MRINKCLVLILVFFVWSAGALAADTPEYKRTEDVIYGRKFGVALTMDVFRPPHPNGKAVIYIVSGGWFSSHEAINAAMYAPMLDHGYTVFAVVHGSQPKFKIIECEADLNRSIRFIRHNAKNFEIDPDHLGCIGASAGGHLSLTLATQGGPGPGNAKDPVDRESSAVQAAVAFFPPTDFLNYGKPGEDAVGVGTLKDFVTAFGPDSETPEGRRMFGRQISPIYFVHSDMPPILIIHGDADKLVPIQQAQSFVAKCEEVNSPAKLIVKSGKGHGWPTIGKDLKTVTQWLDEQLQTQK
jgi:acetyl esterase/lipase